MDLNAIYPPELQDGKLENPVEIEVYSWENHLELVNFPAPHVWRKWLKLAYVIFSQFSSIFHFLHRPIPFFSQLGKHHAFLHRKSWRIPRTGPLAPASGRRDCSTTIGPSSSTAKIQNRCMNKMGKYPWIHHICHISGNNGPFYGR